MLMKEIAILSLTRFGDLIQETPLLRVLKRTYPAARITLIAEKRFSAVLPLIKGFDRAIIFDKEAVGDLIFFAHDPLEPYFCMEEFIRELEQDRYDLVINLTFSRMSAFIVSLMKADRVVGLTTGEKGERLINSTWGTYLFTTQEGNNRIHNQINLVDLFTHLGGGEPDGLPVELTEKEEGSAFADAFLAENGLSGEKLVGLQLGASDPVRCWPPESFAILSDLLQEKLGVRTVFFGASSEEPLAQRAFAAMKGKSVSAVGKTSIAGLFSLLKRCSLLVTNDTGTMHFAAAGRVPSLMLCIGPAFFYGTGPYSTGNLALQADLACAPCRYNFNCPAPLCRDILTPECVFLACGAMLSGERPIFGQSDRVKAFSSFFGADGHLDWVRSAGEETETETLRRRHGRMWKRCLHDGPSPAVILPDGAAPASSALELIRLAEEGIGIAEQIAAACRLAPLPLERLRHLGDAEAALAERIRLFGSLSPESAPLVDFFAFMRENIVSEELSAVAAETRLCYEWARHLAASF
ncbi:MAG TPA: glycosyltransferase family 9 protein [Geobacteraceae bacterium]